MDVSTRRYNLKSWTEQLVHGQALALHPRLRLTLALLGLMLAIITSLLWLYATVGGSPGGRSITLPRIANRSLNVNIWLGDDRPAFWPDAAGSQRRSYPTRLRANGRVSISFTYQHNTGTGSVRNAVLRLPVWPILIVSIASLAVARLLWSARGGDHSPPATP
jgi:hypothetical protein